MLKELERLGKDTFGWLFEAIGMLSWLYRMFPRSMGPRRLVISTLLLGAFVLGLFGTVYARQSIKWESAYMTSKVVDETVYLPPPLALRMSSLGYGPFGGDMLFIRAHAYFLRHINSDRILKWLDPYADAVITLDPDNREIYYWASLVVRYGQIINESTIARSSRFAELGIEHFPDDPRYYEHIGFNLYFELAPLLRKREIALSKLLELDADIGPLQLVERAVRRPDRLLQLAQTRNRRMAIEKEALIYYSNATMCPGSTIDPLFLVTLYVRQDWIGAAAKVAERMYAEASPEQRQHLRARLESLGQNALAERLKKAEDAHKAEMPYAPSMLFELIGSSRSLRVPSTWASRSEAFDDALKALEERETGD